MKMSAVFKNGMCRLQLTPEDEWEQKLLGAIAKGGEKLSGIIEYAPDGHYTYGRCKAVSIQLEAGGMEEVDHG